MTSRLVPAGTRSVRSFTRVAPAGVTTIAPSKAISVSDATMFLWPSVSAGCPGGHVSHAALFESGTGDHLPDPGVHAYSAGPATGRVFGRMRLRN